MNTKYKNQMKPFTLLSEDLGGQIDLQFVQTGLGGSNLSPQLKWINAPEGTRSFAIDMHDKDAPTPGGYWHWLVYNIPSDVNELVRGAGVGDSLLLPKSAVQVANDSGNKFYDGPYPPPGHGWHSYSFTIYALDVESLELPENLPCGGVSFNIWCHTLAKSSIVAYFRNEL